MNTQYTVGMNIDGRSEHVTLEAEDALAAAQKVKNDNPGAAITYSRAANSDERDSLDRA